MTFESDVEALITALGWTQTTGKVSFSIEGAKRLGVDLDGWPEARRSESVVAHVLMADDQSSSHR